MRVTLDSPFEMIFERIIYFSFLLTLLTSGLSVALRVVANLLRVRFF